MMNADVYQCIHGRIEQLNKLLLLKHFISKILNKNNTDIGTEGYISLLLFAVIIASY